MIHSKEEEVFSNLLLAKQILRGAAVFWSFCCTHAGPSFQVRRVTPEFASAVKGLQWAACGVGSAPRRRTFDLSRARRWAVLPGETRSLDSVHSGLRHPSGGTYLLRTNPCSCAPITRTVFYITFCNLERLAGLPVYYKFCPF